MFKVYVCFFSLLEKNFVRRLEMFYSIILMFKFTITLHQGIVW